LRKSVKSENEIVLVKKNVEDANVNEIENASVDKKKKIDVNENLNDGDVPKKIIYELCEKKYVARERKLIAKRLISSDWNAIGNV